ncbi:MAG: hypothetical protein Q9227_004156 [Pyrenula ochraceoflavens]
MSEIPQWKVTQSYVATRCKLGEGPYYNEDRNELRFVDIWNHKLHFVNVEKGPNSLRTIDTGVALGVTADVEGSDLLLTGAKDGLTLFNTETGEHKYLAKFWDHDKDKEHRMRFNDGAVDSKGRFWGGTCNDPKVMEFTPEGVLFRLDPDGSLHSVIEKATIPNGLDWNVRNDTFFWTDSPDKNIYMFDYDHETAKISNRRIFYHVPDEVDAVPDGFAMDEEGCIWSSLHKAGKVIRISPDGNVIGEILLPTRCVTCPTFAGSKIFITSAEEPEPEKYPESARHGGNLFMVDVGVQGRRKNKFRLDKKL